MKSITTIIVLAHFLVYSQSMLVMWGLYFVEKHDIILYYESPGNQNNGLDYMQKMCDSTRGEHSGALALLKICTQLPSYVPVHVPHLMDLHPHAGVSVIEPPPVVEELLTHSVFHPPRT